MIQKPRITAVTALLIVALAVILAARGGNDPHYLHAQFLDAGQLNTGGKVSVATRPIGRIQEISLADNGLADVKLKIADDAWPLHEGTQFAIRLTSQVGVANRYIAVQPGSVTARPLKDGETLGLSNTQGIVDVDQTLNDFTPKVRKDLRRLLTNSERAIDGVAPYGNEALTLSPALLGDSDELLSQINADTPAFRRLLSAGGRVSGAIARNSDAVTESIGNTARLLQALDRQRGALAGSLRKAPPVLTRSTRTLRNLRHALDTTVRPLLKQLQPAAKPLASILEDLPTLARQGVPALQQVRALLPPATRAANLLGPLAKVAIPAYEQTGKAIDSSMPQLVAAREYAPDILVGTAIGFTQTAGFYDANGHYARINFVTGDDGLIGSLDHAFGSPLTSGYSVQHFAPCPGGAAGRVKDGSNRPTADAQLCDAKKDDVPR